MVCPQCGAEYPEAVAECPDCHISLAQAAVPGAENDLDVLVKTGLINPIAIGLAETLLQEAGIPYFAMDRNIAARQESGNFLGWWNIRVSSEREAEAREILQSVEQMK